jgi:hypothetical protein
VGELESILPDDLKNSALASGSELVLPYAEALAAIVLATNHQIAVLGLDAFEVQKDGLRTIYLGDASRYIPFTGDWRAYVADLNADAERWLRESSRGSATKGARLGLLGPPPSRKTQSAESKNRENAGI